MAAQAQSGGDGIGRRTRACDRLHLCAQAVRAILRRGDAGGGAMRRSREILSTAPLFGTFGGECANRSECAPVDDSRTKAGQWLAVRRFRVHPFSHDSRYEGTPSVLDGERTEPGGINAFRDSRRRRFHEGVGFGPRRYGRYRRTSEGFRTVRTL